MGIWYLVLLVVKARFLEVESSLDFPIERSTWDMEPLALAQKTLQAINMMTQKTMPAQTAATTYTTSMPWFALFIFTCIIRY